VASHAKQFGDRIPKAGVTVDTQGNAADANRAFVSKVAIARTSWRTHWFQYLDHRPAARWIDGEDSNTDRRHSLQPYKDWSGPMMETTRLLPAMWPIARQPAGFIR